MKSIRRYLLRSLILTLIAGAALVSIFTYYHAKQEIDELYNKNMEEVASILETNIEALKLDQVSRIGLVGPSLNVKLKHEEDFLIQIWNTDGKLVYTSHRAIPLPLQSANGMVITTFEAKPWRVYVLETERFKIQIAQPTHARLLFVREMALNLLYPLLAIIPMIGLLIWFAIGRSLASLDAISVAIHQRSASSLQPLTEVNIPTEIQPMVYELNALLVRLKTSLDTQRRFTADAAHELRSPLTALQLQLDILTRAETESERKRAGSKLQEGIDRATHLVRQLLTLARMDPETTTLSQQPVNLTWLAQDSIDRHADIAKEKNITLSMSPTDAAVMLGDANALGIMLGNLVINAIRYTPEGGRVELRTAVNSDEVMLEIYDNGIGIPPSEHQRIFERFYRVLGTETEGTGLGLAIVMEVVQQHNGRIAIGTGLEGKGTSFTLRFPL